jgi:pentatricopeptide repeat protein
LPTILPPRAYSKLATRTPPKSSQRTIPPTPSAVEEDENVKVNFFDEVVPGRYRKLRDSEEFSNALSGLDPDVEAMINDLEHKLKDTAQLVKMLDKYGMKDKADELRQVYKLDKQSENATNLWIPDDSWRTPYQRKHVTQLNSFLRSAKYINAEAVKPTDIKRTWKHYSAARRALSAAWDRIPAEVWDFLWRILAWEGDGNPNRMSHLFILIKDLNAARITLTESQQLIGIEAMFLEGYQAEAIELWKKSVSSLGFKPGDSTYREYWELGVRMCSHHGDLERAERAANVLLDSSPETDPRILIPLIRACAQKEVTIDKAWELYHRLRELLGEDMQIEDYDEVIGSFLSTNHTEYGLQSFVDMMFSSPIDIRGKTKLPSAVGNQYFLGKWLKRLIGAGDLEGAYSVLKYMETRGIMGSAIQFNGLIGAWIRSGAADALEKAEELGWAMIRSRLMFVELRQRQAAVEWPLKLRVQATDEVAGLRFVPKATLETFSILAENYRGRGLQDRMNELWAAFNQAEISTDAFMMNQMIETYVQNAKFKTALEFYYSMTQKHHIVPNAHTFLALFNSLAVNRLIVKTEEHIEEDHVLSRRFFKEMVDYPWFFDGDWIHGALPRLVLHSFLKLQDYAGMLAATRAMGELFWFVPTEALLLELAAGTKAVRSPSKRNMELMINSSKKIEVWLQQRHKELQAEGRSLENLTPEDRARELGLVLEKLIFFKATVTEEQLRPLYDKAAREMGVYDVVVEQDPEAISRLRKLPPTKQAPDVN